MRPHGSRTWALRSGGPAERRSLSEKCEGEAIERLFAAGQRGVLVELMWISTLRSAGRRDDAVAAWHATASSWLADEQQVWRSQWVTLEKLHAALNLPEGSQIKLIRERQKTAPE